MKKYERSIEKTIAAKKITESSKQILEEKTEDEYLTNTNIDFINDSVPEKITLIPEGHIGSGLL